MYKQFKHAFALSVLAGFLHGPALADPTVGLFLNSAESYDGYTLFAPQNFTETYLVNNEGKLVRSWTSSYRPGNSVYLEVDGDLLRSAKYAPDGVPRFTNHGGRVERYSWDGVFTWGFDYSTAEYRQHHDIEPMPNGNVLLIAWELKTSAEAIAAGRDPSLLPDGELWPDHIVEVQPNGLSGGTIVWEWHIWDHLVQDFDMTKANYGVVADHPELINLNYVAQGGNPGRADWNHLNGIAYNEELDQIIISSRPFSEFWVIDHSTTTAQAAGHTGGNSGKGGDVLYRWGNPRVYDRGDANDQQLFVQHDTQWIEAGRPGAGNILVFNNGTGRPGGNFSSIDEIVPPVDENGNYSISGSSAFGPAAATWTYTDPVPTNFYGSTRSGTQRLPNGNTLICTAGEGKLFEVKPDGTMVWMYINPVDSSGAREQGDTPVTNAVFKVRRYGADYPGLAGRDLTPSDPVEQYTRPIPAGTSPLTVAKAGQPLEVAWDVSCGANDYNLLYGDLSSVSTYDLQGAECAIGIAGVHEWPAPAGDLFFLVVGVDATGVYESSWGLNGSVQERNDTQPSNLCGVTTKDSIESCP